MQTTKFTKQNLIDGLLSFTREGTRSYNDAIALFHKEDDNGTPKRKAIDLALQKGAARLSTTTRQAKLTQARRVAGITASARARTLGNGLVEKANEARASIQRPKASGSKSTRKQSARKRGTTAARHWSFNGLSVLSFVILGIFGGLLLGGFILEPWFAQTHDTGRFSFWGNALIVASVALGIGIGWMAITNIRTKNGFYPATAESSSTRTLVPAGSKSH